MSRIMKVMIVLLAITAMVAPTVFAEDRLSLNGAFRIRGFYEQNDGFTEDNDTSKFDQRFRLGGNINVAEGVKLVFRTDITEATWGSGTDVYGAGRPGSTQQWDRAYAELKKNGMMFRGGQQNFLLGLNGSIDHQGTGLLFNTGGAIPVTLFWARADDNAGATDANDDIFAVNVGHKTDMYAADVFLAYVGEDVTDTGVDVEAYLVGVSGEFFLNAAKVMFELDYFDGEVVDTTVDVKGLQFYLDGSMALNETVTLGGIFLYAQGADAGDAQITRIGNGFNDWDPVGYGPFTTQLGNPRVFDFTGDAAGVIGAELYSTVKINDDLTLTGAFSYLTPEEDDETVTDVDNALVIDAFAQYMVMANTNVAAGIQYTSLDYNKTMPVTASDDNLLGAMRLQIKF